MWIECAIFVWIAVGVCFLQFFEDELDSAIDEFNEQQRYRNFVELLKFFVDIQEFDYDTIK